MGSSLLLPRAWAAVLRLLLQSGVPSAALRALAGPPGDAGADAALEETVWARLPGAARDSWLAHPHRMGSTEDEVRTRRPFCHGSGLM